MTISESGRTSGSDPAGGTNRGGRQSAAFEKLSKNPLKLYLVREKKFKMDQKRTPKTTKMEPKGDRKGTKREPK